MLVSLAGGLGTNGNPELAIGEFHDYAGWVIFFALGYSIISLSNAESERGSEASSGK